MLEEDEEVVLVHEVVGHEIRNSRVAGAHVSAPAAGTLARIIGDPYHGLNNQQQRWIGLTGLGETSGTLDGIYVLESGATVDGVPRENTRQTAAYDLALDALPPPTVDLDHRHRITLSEGKASWSAEEVYTASAPFTLTIGDCAYEAIEITLVYSNEFGANPERTVLHYIPELGISHFAAYGFDGDPMVRFSPVSIEALP